MVWKRHSEMSENSEENLSMMKTKEKNNAK